MNTQNRLESASVKDKRVEREQSLSGQSESEGRGKIAKQLPNKKTGGVGKNSANYWITRLIRPVNSRGVESPHYSFRTLFKGRRGAFSTGTGNKEGAAKIAAGIYSDLLAMGWDATLAKHRPTNEPDPDLPLPVASVGAWITAARKVSEVNANTFTSYSRALRKIVGDILAVEKSKKRFGPKKGGAAGYRAIIDGASLEVLTLSAITKWRLEYVGRAKTPAEQRSRMTSCNSTIRQARSLFGGTIKYLLQDTKLQLPTPVPFDFPPELKGNKKKHPLFYKPQSAKYSSRIDARTLLQDARRELSESEPAAFLAMLLALSAGLRKGEIDSLQWHQVDFTRQLIRIEFTDAARLKSDKSCGDVPIDPDTIALLRGFHAKKTGVFVIEAEGAESGPKKWGQHYRAGAVFDKLNAWLRKHGVKVQKPLHELRKELGALITTKYGIFAAKEVLRHSDISTTARHYAEQKDRPVINVGGWLNDEENIEQFPTPQVEPGRKGKAATPRKRRAAI
jgi:hypothetical protein